MSRVALLDIGSSSVGGVLLEKGKIIFSTRRPIVLQEQLDANRFLNNVAKAARELVEQISRVGVPDRVICFLSAPFYASRTSVIEKEEQESFTFTKKVLDELVAGEISKFRERESRLFAAGEDGHEILESGVLNISLNGYPLDNPYGQEAERVEVRYYLSIAATRILNRLRAAVSGPVHVSRVEFHSFSYTLFRALDQLFPADHHYLALEIGGELSELSLVWKSVLEETVSFPAGQHWLLRSLSAALRMSVSETASLLELFQTGRAGKSAKEKLEQVLPRLRADWLKQFREALALALDNSLLPDQIYLLGEAPAASLFLAWLSEENFGHLMLGSRKFRVKLLDRNLLLPIWAEPPTLRDTPLLVEKIFYDRILAN